MKILLLFLFCFCSVCFPKIINLGSYGQTKSVNVMVIRQGNEKYLQKEFSQINLKSYFKNIPAPKISFHTSLPIAKSFYSFSKRLNTKTQYPDTTMVFFGINKASKKFLKANKNVKFTYGYCIDFNSLSALQRFKQEMNITYPVGIINDDNIFKELGITSYPAIIRIKNNVETIQEGLK